MIPLCLAALIALPSAVGRVQVERADGGESGTAGVPSDSGDEGSWPTSHGGAGHDGTPLPHGRDVPSPLPVDQSAAELLAEYECLGKCALVRAGYLDLLGEVWCCVVQGDGWVDVCEVRPAEGGGSLVTRRRLDSREWAERCPVGRTDG